MTADACLFYLMKVSDEQTNRSLMRDKKDAEKGQGNRADPLIKKLLRIKLYHAPFRSLICLS